MSGSPPRILKKGAALPANPEELLATARERARLLVGEAEAEAEARRASARREAVEVHAAALAAGHAEGMGRAAAALARVAEVGAARMAMLEAVVLDVALEVASRVLGRELAAAPDAGPEAARRALRAARGSGEVVLRISPEDRAAIAQDAGALRGLVERGALTVAEDPSLAHGEVIVEAEGGRVDARVEAQLEHFRRALEAEGP